MAKAKRPIIDKNVEKFINNNFGRKERRKEDSFKFELFVNSMHIWHLSSQSYNSNTKIGKDISLGTAQGGDAFFISVNNMEKLFTLEDSIDDVIEYLKKSAKSITFHFIQTKKSESANWKDLLNFIDVPLIIWKGQKFSKSQPMLVRLQNFIDAITDDDDAKLGKITHKIEIDFYTNKDDANIEALRKDWKTNIENKRKELEHYFGSEKDGIRNVIINLKGAGFLNEIYEKLNSNEYSLKISKLEVTDVGENYLIGYLTAKELLDSIAPEISGTRSLYPDVFKNNIRLYLGGTDVNKDIEKTLDEEPEKFHFYNNGLTITTKNIDPSNSKNFIISPVNIVNGCQTANSIFNVFKSKSKDIEKVKIPVRIIVAQDKEYEDITIRSNTQNGLEAKDLISITNIQKEIEEEFEKANFLGKKFVYKRQKSDSDDVEEADFIVQIDDILRVTFSTMMLIPNKVSGYYDVTTRKFINKVFDERFSKLYLILTVLLKLVEEAVETNYPDFNRLKYHLCYLVYKFVNKGLEIGKIEEYFRGNKEEIETDEEEVDAQNDLINKIYSNLYTVLKSEESFESVLKYITDVIKKDYPELLDLSDKQKERILYSPVEKLKNIRKTPVFEKFNEKFASDFRDLLEKTDVAS